MCECSFILWTIMIHRGYTAPEYAMHGQLSEKADTYSYGIVVLEIVSGHRSTDVKDDEDGEYLLRRVSKFLYIELGIVGFLMTFDLMIMKPLVFA